jgi:tetratricopeptide (TPR) repeat protein
MATLAAAPETSAVREPNPERWRLKDADHAHVSWSCTDRPWSGATTCQYDPRGWWRRFHNLRHGSIEERVYVFVEVTPLLCPWDEARPFAHRALEQLARDRAVDAATIRDRADNVLVLEGRALRTGYVAIGDGLVLVEVQVPGGLNAQDAQDFESVLASASSVSTLSAFRRGLWLRRHRYTTRARGFVPMCGLEAGAREERALVELERAALEEPDRFEPWALQGELVEERAGGPDVITALLAGEGVALDRGAVWQQEGEAERRIERRKLDRDALRQAARLYAEALRRDPPAHPERELGDDPMDRSTILARRARVHAALGDVAQAERLYADALAFGDEGTWGTLEASFWLAERAWASGAQEQSRALYLEAERAWWAFYEVDWLHSENSAAMRLRIERRLRDLGP